MEVFINNTKHQVQEKTSLFELLKLQQLSEKKGIAVAVNNKVVPRVQWNTHELRLNDSITVIKATQGG